MKNIFLYLLPVLFMFTAKSCMNQQPRETTALALQWETEAVFDIPESVYYEPGEDVIYISNVSGNPTDRDSNGFISKCTPGGEVIELQWATGLHAPKGMGVYNGKLYASDIHRVAEIDLATGGIFRYHDVPGASFLNDIAVDGQGNVYISDMMDTKIYRISDDTLTLWLDDPMLTTPNGLFVLDNHLMIGCDKIIKANLQDKSLEEWLLDTGGIDGLESTGDGRFLFSDWQGSVYLVAEDKSVEKLLDLNPQQKNAADIEFEPSEKMLFVPTFSANTVMAYTLEN